MIVCPICENAQAQGDTCEVCGRVLAVRPVQETPVLEMDGLEQTRLERAAEAAAAPMPELELTAQRSGPDLPGMAFPDLERTQRPPADEVPILPMDEIELGRAEDDGQRTAVPTGQVTCRYCRHVQADGAICEACGMRLPRVAAPAEKAARPGLDDDVWGVCPKCGSRAKVGRRCGECGVVMQMPEA
jgi:methionyl-tRNA synthetase